jgi:hypothetical protein
MYWPLILVILNKYISTYQRGHMNTHNHIWFVFAFNDGNQFYFDYVYICHNYYTSWKNSLFWKEQP